MQFMPMDAGAIHEHASWQATKYVYVWSFANFM
jgi:hypothetical protein